VSPRRRAGAPRLIEWTGERCVPWTPDVQVVYEHFHRYLWARDRVAGRRVLDLGSGEGFGAAILAERATGVVGVDIDEKTVEHATMSWADERVTFRVGSATDLQEFEDGSFGAVVAFEVIEHLGDQEQMLAEIARVIGDDGLLIVSTPDRRLYSEASGQENPFHERELTREELEDMLGARFGHVAMWAQRTITGSHVRALGSREEAPGGPDRAYFIERSGDEWHEAGDPVGMYLVALASNAELPDAPLDSTLADCDLQLLRAAERRAADVIGSRVRERDEALARERAARAELADVGSVRAAYERELRVRERELGNRDRLVIHRREELERAREQLQASRQEVHELRVEFEETRAFAAQVRSSVTWQTFQRVRGRLFATLGGERSVATRALQLCLRLAGRVTSPAAHAASQPEPEPVPPAGEPIRLPTFERPTVSLIVPIYSGAELTRRCLESIRDNTERAGYEVILVDDTADEESKRLLELVEGARIVRNERNLGYSASVGRGAQDARGEWLVLCNNDIEVHPGWLVGMLECATAYPDAAIVTPKYLDAEGKLSEAGGLIWSDGTGANYGRGGNPHDFHYNYTREVDYGSAAALLVRTDFWREIGGYDERFAPMYYEDVDLAFQARQHGYRVMYEPSAVVTHVEGGTAGTDPNASHKRHQEANRSKFVDKWSEQLGAAHLRPGAARMRRAAERFRGPRVLVVDFRVPMKDRDAGSLRMYEILRSLVRDGYAVTLLPDNLVALEPYTGELQRLGVEVVHGAVDLNRELAEIGPELTAAILSRPHSASRWLDTVREHAPAATIAYDTVDLHWVRESRRFALDHGAPASTNGVVEPLGPKAVALRELELALVRMSDVTVAVTEDEREQLLRHVPTARVSVIPTIHEVAAAVEPPGRREGVLFVGGFEHPPNGDAATFLVREVMPLVWARVGEVPVTIVGGSAPPEVEALAGPQVEVVGWVQDLHPLLESARALVVPVRFGAGVKGKITQGLAAGLPVVTTTIGAEGLGGEDGSNMLIADDARGLAERVASVLEDDALWEAVSVGGLELVQARCSPAVLDERLRELLEQGRSDGPVLRGAGQG